MQRNALGFSNLESCAEFPGQDPEVDDDSEVMKKACEISFPRIAQIDLARQALADQGAAQRMLPKDDGIDACFACRKQVQHTARHRNIADVMNSQADHRSAQ